MSQAHRSQTGGQSDGESVRVFWEAKVVRPEREKEKVQCENDVSQEPKRLRIRTLQP